MSKAFATQHLAKECVWAVVTVWSMISYGCAWNCISGIKCACSVNWFFTDECVKLKTFGRNENKTKSTEKNWICIKFIISHKQIEWRNETDRKMV